MTSHLRTLGLMVLVFAATAVSSFFVFRPRPDTKDAPSKSERVAEKGLGLLYLNKSIVIANGIETESVKTIDWHARLFVDGRVLPNPSATWEVRAPFAGILQSDPETTPDKRDIRLGELVKPNARLALFEARFNVVEQFDLKSKSKNAEIDYTGKLAVWKARAERHKLLVDKASGGGLSQYNLTQVAIEEIESRTAKDSAMAQWDLWKEALASAGKKTITVPIRAPAGGEITDVGALPGANVEAGQLLVRIIDFQRVLIRLDFPLAADNVAAPKDVNVETPGADVRWNAILRGKAANVEVGLQKIGYLYEIVPHSQAGSPGWRPGLYVKAVVDDPARSARPAVEIPASALLIHVGRDWVYVKLDPDDPGRDKYRFQRRQVEVLGRAGDKAYIAATGWLGDELVVSKRALTLLSEEVRPDVDDD